MKLREHNPFRAFGVVDPAIATERTGLGFLQSMLERREPSPPFSETTPASPTHSPPPSPAHPPSIHNTEPITMNDVIIIGGSFAGLAAALQLGRARRKVTVLDTGLPRNRFAGHSHGLLGHDHKPPLDILAEARQQLARYPTIRLVSARADSISGAIDDFSVLTADGEGLRARRLILSYGVVDQMPDVPGFAEGWGTSIVPCPYCDGFEVAGQHWGLVWSGPQSHNHRSEERRVGK